jgi:hypothetical protein
MILSLQLRPFLPALLLAALPLFHASAQTGPMVGTVRTTEARFLYRPGAVEKTLRLSVLNAAGQVVGSSEATSPAVDDHVAKFHVTGLSAATRYTYRLDDITGGTAVPIAGPADGLKFSTPLATGTKGVVTAAFASCANASAEPVWQRMGLLGIDQLFLMGDTPYIDTADLASIRTKHRAFLETPFMASLIRGTPTASIWDDHDFGLNNGNGASFAAGKPNTRRGFVEYRAHEQYGTGTEGVYHKLDLGVMEVFLLDPRWFSETGPSPVDPAKRTGLGPAQWQWLLDALAASRAPFKVLAMGEVWQDKKNSETDDQFTYWFERDALFNFIRDRKIPGVVLLGGDIHVSRHLIHRQRLGYDLHDFITSPAHTSVIPSLDVPHPDLEWSSQESRQFLTLTADTRVNPAVLTARYLLHDGTVQREVVIPYDQLTPKAGAGLGKDLRAWWNFDGDLENESVLGARMNATAVNGAALIADGGLRGGAVEFTRSASQYLVVGRSALDDNSAGHSVSLWCKPASLPAHGSSERHFLYESTLGGTVSNDAAYTLSLGFQPTDDPAKINLELHTHNVQASATVGATPVAVAHGPFPCVLDRSLFTGRWAHVVTTYDSTRLRLHVDGVEVAVHLLPQPGPASENGGLVLGGHRTGTGRNYDGRLDEVAIWSRVLTPAEITALHHGGSPEALPVEVSAADSDGDTLDDWWETLHGLDPENADDALADADADGVPAWLEKEAGTHPQNDDSAIFDYLRAMVNPGMAGAPLAFRHPSRGTVEFEVRAQLSGDLDGWELLTPDPGLTADIAADALEFQLDPVPPAPRFFRLQAFP